MNVLNWLLSDLTIDLGDSFWETLNLFCLNVFVFDKIFDLIKSEMLSVGREGFDLLALLILKADKNINILLLQNGLELLHKLIKGIGVVDHLINFLLRPCWTTLFTLGIEVLNEKTRHYPLAETAVGSFRYVTNATNDEFEMIYKIRM